MRAVAIILAYVSAMDALPRDDIRILGLSGALIVLDIEHVNHLEVTLRVATPDTLR
jgi:hypothetical protein